MRSGCDSLGGQQDDPPDAAGLGDVEDVPWAQQVRAGAAALQEQRVGSIENGPKALRLDQVRPRALDALRHVRV